MEKAMTIARVFPRRTRATPDDELAFVGDPPLFLPAADEVHISCAFTWDKPVAERLAGAWARQGYPVRLGGPAYDAPAGDFAPGMYVKPGMTITSRGCIRRCPFCFVPQREGKLRLLDIKPGWDILDNNLLACPRSHIEAVLDMLEGQPCPARFTGGIDARLVEPWFAERLGQMRVQILYTAYDLAGAKPAVERAVNLFRAAGLSQRQVGCFVLIGHAADTLDGAQERVEWVRDIGATPFAMLYRSETNEKPSREWRDFARLWMRPAAIFAKSSQRIVQT